MNVKGRESMWSAAAPGCVVCWAWGSVCANPPFLRAQARAPAVHKSEIPAHSRERINPSTAKTVRAGAPEAATWVVIPLCGGHRQECLCHNLGAQARAPAVHKSEIQAHSPGLCYTGF